MHDRAGELGYADVEADGARHDEVVVCANDGSVAAVVLAFVDEHFVEASLVALHICPFAHGLHQRGYCHRLGVGVGVEAVFARQTLAHFFGALRARIEVGIGASHLLKDVERLVAFDLPEGVACLQGVALYHEEGVGV